MILIHRVWNLFCYGSLAAAVTALVVVVSGSDRSRPRSGSSAPGYTSTTQRGTVTSRVSNGGTGSPAEEVLRSYHRDALSTTSSADAPHAAIESLAPYGALPTTSPEVHVRGYLRSDGSFVTPHFRTAPNDTRTDNWSTLGNVNPHTGAPGTIPLD